MSIKGGLPWQIKFGIKIFFGIFHVNYKLLKRIGLVEHGKMESAEFALSVFERQYKIAEERYPESIKALRKGFFELGPGDSILSAIIAGTKGYKKSCLIDVGNFETTTADSIRKILNEVEYDYLFDEVDDYELKASICNRFHIQYFFEGLKSFNKIDSNCISFSYSNTVLQHVAKPDLAPILTELYRIHHKGSISIHSINFTDHFSGGFRNRWFPEKFWESSLIKRANLYTNRLNLYEILVLAESSGFRGYVYSYEIQNNLPIVVKTTEFEKSLSFLKKENNIIRATIYLIKE